MIKKGLSKVNAIVLAGGFGIRLKPVITEKPKCLAVIGGRPFLSYILDQLHSFGIRKTILCTGYKAEMVEREYRNDYKGMQIHYSREAKPLGTAGALRKAMDLVKSEDVFVLNGDSYCLADLNRFYRIHQLHEANVSILLSYTEDTVRFGRVYLEESGRVIKFSEKEGEWEPGWINAGIYLIKKRLLASIPSYREVSIEKEMFPSWIGNKFFGFKCEGFFIDIGTPESYLEAKRKIPEIMDKINGSKQH